MAKLGKFRRRTDKIWNGTRRAVPHENLKSFLAQVRAHCAPDNSEADYSNNFSIWAEHTKSNALGDGRYFREGQTAGKNARRQRRSLRIPGSSRSSGLPRFAVASAKAAVRRPRSTA